MSAVALDTVCRGVDRLARRWSRWRDPQPKPSRPYPEWTGDVRAFYANPYWLARQRWYRAHDRWHTIARVMRGQRIGRFLEYGCGIAPVARWVAPRFPEWEYTLIDLPSPHRTDAILALSPYTLSTELSGGYDVIVCLEVLEHLEEPLVAVQTLVRHLLPGGHLYVNYVDDPPDGANLCRQRPECLAYLREHLRLVSTGDYEHWEAPG